MSSFTLKERRDWLHSELIRIRDSKPEQDRHDGDCGFELLRELDDALAIVPDHHPGQSAADSPAR